MTSDFRSPEANFLRGLKVCFVAGTLGQGGAERQLFYNLKCLTEHGARVDLLCLTRGEHWEQPISELGVAVHYVGGPRFRLGRLLKIVLVVRHLRPQILQSQHFYTNAYSAVAARLLGFRAIGAVRGSGQADMQNCGHWLAQASLRWPHLLAANSRAAVQVLMSLGCPEHKLHFLPNVIDVDRFHPAGEVRGVRPLTILGIGRLGPEKRWDRFLRILTRIKQSGGIPFRAIIAGAGPMRGDVEGMARAAGLYPDTVQFCGSVADAAELYRQVDLLLLTSDHEGTPNVVMEAMASGLPVVATAVGGVPDLVESGLAGFTLAPEDEPGLAVAICRLLQDETLRHRLGGQGRERINTHHALSSLPGQIEALYRRSLPIANSAASPVEAKAV